MAACALLAPPAGAQERSVVVAFVSDAEVLERTDLAVGRLIGTPTVDAWRRGETLPIAAGGRRDVEPVRALDGRLDAIGDRRLPVAAALVLAMLLLFRRPQTAALTALWAPATALVAGALTPSLPVEMAIVAAGSTGLAVLTQRTLPWPRAAALPALTGVAGYAADVALGSDLTIRSLLGPDPALGARFYGIGNELEAILPVLLLIGVAALKPRRPGAAFGSTMAVLAVIVGAGRFGADAGGVITIGVAAAVAVAWPLRGPRVVLAAAVPVAALATLAAIDLATGADSHFSRTVLDDPGNLPNVVRHRYELAWETLIGGLMPLATAAAIAAATYGIRRRSTIAPLPVWRAALAGGLAGSVAGALVNDSGPLLFVLGVAVLAAGTVYVRTGATRTEAVQPGP